jgi:hypothetical protein
MGLLGTSSPPPLPDHAHDHPQPSNPQTEETTLQARSEHGKIIVHHLPLHSHAVSTGIISQIPMRQAITASQSNPSVLVILPPEKYFEFYSFFP